MILLDTNIVVAYFNGDDQVVSKVVEKINKIALSALVIAELDYGAKASQNSTRNLAKLNQFIDLVHIVTFDLACARMLGTIKSKLRKIGKPTGEVDAMIAAVAMVHKAELVTGNIRHFQNIDGLKISSWI
jgi:tRNA(fMet)-specific endonuclease VapC